MTYKYYSPQRPVSPGTFPGKPIEIVNYDNRQWVKDETFENGEVCAWGYLIYEHELSETECDNYELMPTRGK